MHTCNVCKKYKTKYKSHLESHLNGKETRNHQTDEKTIYIIKKQLYNMYPKKYSKPQPIVVHNNSNALDNANNPALEHKLEQQSEQIDELLKTIQMLVTNRIQDNQSSNKKVQINQHVDSQTVNIINQTTINQSNHIHCYKHPDLSMLTFDILQKIADDVPGSAPFMFDHIFHNPDYKGNHIFYQSNKSSSDVNTLCETGWEVKSKSQIISDYMEHMYRMPMMLFMESLMDQNLLTEEECESKLDKLYDESRETIAPINKTISNSFIKHREMTKDTYKEYKHLTNEKSAQDVIVKPPRHIPGLDEEFNKKLLKFEK